MRNGLLRSFAVRVKGLGICLLVTLLFAAAVVAQTQITTGTIQGTVLDANGAAVPGASVEIKNLDTNATRNISTDEDGRFAALQLPPGRYSVTVSKQGFATVVLDSASLTVGQAINLPLSMKVSQVEERVTITAPTVDTVKTEASTTLNDTTVSNTPILGRKFEDLLTLTPGVSIVQGPDGDEISFAGQRGTFNNVSLDGGDYNNGFFGEQAGGQRAAIDIPLDAVREFQVVATGASAEFGRTAGGVINVITKSGTNEFHGSLFHFQRLEALTANTSDGKPLTDFHREQFGGTIGGPIKEDKVFFFFANENIRENLTKPNLSEPSGTTPCPVATPTIIGNEALITTNADCQRLALLSFFRTSLNQDDGQPVKRPVRNSAFLGKIDWNLSSAHKLALSYNFDHSRNENQTFDVATYGNSANGTEGPSKIHVFNFNLFSTISPTKLNEAHFTYSREARPRAATASNIPADVGVGGLPFSRPGASFRFGNPFFLQPTVDELFWRTQLRDSVSIVSGNHTVKFGGEWLHSLNDQIFRGFFTGRYLFDSVPGFLRYVSPAALGPGFGPAVAECSDGTFGDITIPASCPTGFAPSNSFSFGPGPLVGLIARAGRTGPAGDENGKAVFDNEDLALFIQDRWQARSNLTLSFGLRWEAQILPEPFVPPTETAYARFLNDPRFPSDGTLPSQKKQFQPRVGFAWDIGGQGKSVLRGSYGIYYARQNMLSQVSSLTTNGVQLQAPFLNTAIIGFGAPAPVFPGVPVPPPLPAGQFNDFTGVAVFARDYKNPRVYTTNIAFEQQIAADWAVYFDFTHAKGVNLTRFINVNFQGGAPTALPLNGDRVLYLGPPPFGPQLGDVFVTFSNGKALYRAFTSGIRKRFSRHYQMEMNYVLAKDLDDDSNERDPFTDRTFNRFDLSKDYSLSDRDIRHKFNFYVYSELPGGFDLGSRIQARSAQPITPSPRVLNGVDRGRNSARKDNKYFSFDWRLQRPFEFGERYALVPVIEMFNTFNNKNNVNPLSTPPLTNFDGFLRLGVGDPRQVQFALKFEF
jgi:Carboxypeptidase regulatory-like domain/TonB-dependent Receptor Plug Domain